MEIPYLFSVFTFLIFLFFITKLLTQSKAKISKINLPPGPSKLPLIGNLHHLISKSLPHSVLRDLAKKYGPIMHLQLGEFSAIVASSPQMAKDILQKHDTKFANRPETAAFGVMFYDKSDIGFAPYGDYWRQMRKIFNQELLSVQSVKSFSCIREEEVNCLIESIKASMRSPINLTEHIFFMTSGIICTVAFGKKYREQETLLRLMGEEIALAGGFSFEDLFPSLKFLHGVLGVKRKLRKVHKRVDEILDSIIEEHKAKRGHNEDEDIIDVLLRVQENGGLEFPITYTNIKALIYDIFLAGTEASSTTINWAIAELIKNTKAMEKAQAELKKVLKGKNKINETDIEGVSYLKWVIKETLRLHPPSPLLLPRECIEQCQIEGYDIPAKTKAFVNVWAISRDPRYWKDPESFIPERFENISIDFSGNSTEYIPFGGGRRICPGISFGIANIELPLAQLLYQFDWKLAGDIKPENLDMNEALGSAIRKRIPLILIATRNPDGPSSTE